MIEAYKKFWKGYVDFKGRSTRSDYWFVYLVNVLITFAYFLLQAVFGGLAAATDSSFLAVISLILLLILFCLWYCCVFTWYCSNGSSFA